MAKSIKSLEKYKRTKIIATLGPATDYPDVIERLIESGANGFRLNFSHGTRNEHKKRIKMVRDASEKLDSQAAIIQDLQGPHVRLGKLKSKRQLHVGEVVKFGYEVESDEVISVQYNIAEKAKPRERIYINDGKVQGIIKKVDKDVITVAITVAGPIDTKKGINLPDTDFQGDMLTEKDYEDVDFAIENDIDYIAMSFVQTKEDIRKLRSYLKERDSDIRIIAKIETKKAVENLEDIIIESDGTMVARGDLAIELSVEAVPVEQRRIIGLCIDYGKISIVATEMLASMIDNRQPTRAEVSDVATAVIVGADAVMLSGETAIGNFPVEAVQIMNRVTRYTEQNSPVKPLFMHETDHSIQSSISSAIMTLAHQVQAKAIIAETASGKTALSIASHRPKMPIIMITDNERVAHQLAIAYGGKTYYRKRSKGAAQRVTEFLKEKNLLKPKDKVVLASGKYPGVSGGTDTIKVRTIE